MIRRSRSCVFTATANPTWSGHCAAQNEPWLLYDGLIEGDTFRIFELPELPEEFLSERGRRLIRVTLAFDPPTRPTRKDSYLGFWMDSRSTGTWMRSPYWRPTEHGTETNSDQLEWGPSGRSDLARNKIKLQPSSNVRKGGTLQSAWIEIVRQGWAYKEEPRCISW